jgi:quercetin dioxygenase-like cupin family protein
MKRLKILIGVVLFFMNDSVTIAQAQPTRKDLLQALIDPQKVSQVEAKEVTIPAGQAAPKHMHPCPVVGYVSSGSVLFQIEGEEKKIINQGEAFYEPKDKVILHFDNASTEKPLVFIAFYLKEEKEELIKLLK